MNSKKIRSVLPVWINFAWTYYQLYCLGLEQMLRNYKNI